MPPPLATIEFQVNGFLWVGVRQALDQIAHRDFDPELLAQFADEARFKGLMGLALPAREFPEATEVSVCMALGDEEPAVAKD